MNILSKYKKILLVIGFVLIIIIVGYFIYSLFLKPSLTPTGTTPTGTTTTPGGLPTAQTGQGQIIETTDSTGLPAKQGTIITPTPSQTAQGGLTTVKTINHLPTLNPNLSNDGSSVRYYSQNDGKFYKINQKGEAVLMSDKIFYEVENAVWSPKGDEAIIEYPDGSNIIYDFSTEKQITLPSHWKDFGFSPNGSQIVMKSIGLDTDNRWLAISNKDGSQAKQIEALGEKDETVHPSWQPNNQSIAMYTEGVNFDQQEVYFVGLHGENFKSTVIEGRGFQPKWTPEGNQLLYSVYSSNNELKPNLWIVSADGENIGSNRKNLNIETWADKCVFTNTTDIYCAVPEKLEAGAGLFPEMANNTKDNLYKIDTRTGLKKLVATPDNDYNMSNLILSDNERYLYFTDQTNQSLHQIKLK